MGTVKQQVTELYTIINLFILLYKLTYNFTNTTHAVFWLHIY